MFIDFLTLLLINMSAGFFLLACFVYKGLDGEVRKDWASGFVISGTIAFLFGMRIVWTWPLPGSYNVAYGELSVFLGKSLLGAALAPVQGCSILPVSIYAVFAGAASLVTGLRFIVLNLTNDPLLSGIGFILSGLTGILAPAVLYWRNNKTVRVISCIGLLIIVFIWARTGYLAYWYHLSTFTKWTPATMR